MSRYVFDIESDGLLDTISKIHSTVLLNADTGEMLSHADQPDYKPIDEGLNELSYADEIIGHHIIRYDLPALKKVKNGWSSYDVPITDTITLARLIYPDIKTWDAQLLKQGKLPGKLYGSHSLEAWGKRIGVEKPPYDGGWEKWSPEMQAYCEGDVRTTLALYKFLKPENYSQKAIALEHRVAKLCFKIEQNGWPFDVAKATKLYADLAQKRNDLAVSLRDLFPPWEKIDRIFTPKRDNKTRGYIAGTPVTIMKTETFNPSSRQHIGHCLKAKYGWKPTEVTENGQAVIDDEVLSALPYPEAKQLAEYFLIEKRIGALAEGPQAWLKVEQNGKVHASYNPNGTVTGRATHSHPNIGQVPSLKNAKGVVPYGHECRELFHVPKGWTQLGADMSGLELRCLGHYMSFFDGGEYIKVVTGGNVHEVNRDAAGLDTEARAKRFIYAFLYGGGDAKIGEIIGKGAFEGKKLKKRFLDRTPALKRLKAHVGGAAGKGFVRSIDGRHIPIRSQHAALNSLLQSTGSILCKEWICLIEEELLRQGYRHGWEGDFAFLGWIHDEVQIAVREGLEETVSKICIEMATKAGSIYDFKCPIASKAKLGKNWAETH